jgi:exonuclease V gamma subunit
MEESELPDSEPFAPDSLERYQINAELLNTLVSQPAGQLRCAQRQVDFPALRRQPLRAHFRRHLLHEESELPDSEPFAPDSLERYQINAELLNTLVNGDDPAQAHQLAPESASRSTALRPASG